MTADQPALAKRSFAPVADARARVLVLGSLPGERSLAEQRYYAHPANQFWRLIGDVVSRDLVTLGYNDRLRTLREARVALWDVVATARRVGSADAELRDVAVNNLSALVATLPELRAVGFNGAKALAVGRSQLGRDADRLSIVALPSSSPLHTIGVAAKLPAWRQLMAFL